MALTYLQCTILIPKQDFASVSAIKHNIWKIINLSIFEFFLFFTIFFQFFPKLYNYITSYCYRDIYLNICKGKEVIIVVYDSIFLHNSLINDVFLIFIIELIQVTKMPKNHTFLCHKFMKLLEWHHYGIYYWK